MLESLRLRAREYASFAGRASRTDYWLNYIAVSIGLAVLAGVHQALRARGFDITVPMLVAAAALMIRVFAITARRLHDMGRSGWWLLVSLIPYAGLLVILPLCFVGGQPGSNRYGRDPRTAVV